MIGKFLRLFLNTLTADDKYPLLNRDNSYFIKTHSYFCCCHWNVNSLPTDNYCKAAALKAYNSVYKYDFLCVSETFLNSSFESNDKDLMIEGYNLIRSDHPSNTNRGCVCIFHKESCNKGGELNARSPAWWSEDIITLHGTQIDSLTTTHGFKQIISDPTHILPQPSCCIYLIFTNQPKYLIERGTHPSLHPN